MLKCNSVWKNLIESYDRKGCLVKSHLYPPSPQPKQPKQRKKEEAWDRRGRVSHSVNGSILSICKFSLWSLHTIVYIDNAYIFRWSHVRICSVSTHWLWCWKVSSYRARYDISDHACFDLYNYRYSMLN